MTDEKNIHASRFDEYDHEKDERDYEPNPFEDQKFEALERQRENRE